MNKINQLDQLSPIADEMLAGLETDEAMRLRILRAARTKGQPERRKARRFAPAMAVAAAVLICTGVVMTQAGDQTALPPVTPVAIEETAAGEPVAMSIRSVADLGDGASVSKGRSGTGSLFAESSGEIPLVTVKGYVYRMLAAPQDIGDSLLKQKMGKISVVTEQPSLASDGDVRMGLSNVAAEGATVYAVKGLSTSTAVAAQVDGSVRLFQRVSYAGRGPTGETLSDVFAVRGKVKSVTLDGVGELSGSEAKKAVDVLLDCATLKSADTGRAKQYLTVTLDSGLRLQLGVSGDTLMSCGSWSCPEFFEAFEAAVK